jgi:hypothetical protein
MSKLMFFYSLTVRMPGEQYGHSTLIAGSDKKSLVHQAANLVRAFARSKGVSPFAIDYAVTRS